MVLRLEGIQQQRTDKRLLGDCFAPRTFFPPALPALLRLSQDVCESFFTRTTGGLHLAEP